MADDKGKRGKPPGDKAEKPAEATKGPKLPKMKEMKVGWGHEPRSPLIPLAKMAGSASKPMSDEHLQQMRDRQKRGEKPEGVGSPGLPTLEDTFTEENVEKFILGDITWGQLHAITQEDAYAFAKYAYAQYEAGRYFDAKKIFQALVIINPYDSYYHMMHGACLQMLDENEAALDEYTAAVQLDSTNIQALVNRAELNLQAARFDEAARDLKRVSELDPRGTGPATQRARALAVATAQAILSFQGVLNKDSGKDSK